MINISDDLKVLLKKGSANTLVKIECGNFIFGYNNNTAVNDNKILELKVNRTASYDDYPLGNAYSCYADITLWDIPANAVLKGQKTNIYVGYMINDFVEWIPLGVYYPEKPSRSGQCLSFTAYDKMYSLSFAYEPNISGNQTPIAILEDIARAGGFELDNSVYTTAAGNWDSIDISLLYGNDSDKENITSFSVSDCISYLAGYVGANAMFNREGKLELFRFADAVDENSNQYAIDDDCVNDVIVEETDSRVEYITCNNGVEEITSYSAQLSSSAKGIRFNNPLIRTQAQLDTIKDTILGNGVFSYRVISLCHLCGNPAWDCFDVITYEDCDGNSYNFPLMSVEIVYDGSIVCNLQSFSKSDDEQNQSGMIFNKLVASSVSKQTQHLSERISRATESITNAVGGLVALIDKDGDGVPDELIAGEHKVDLAGGSEWRTQGRCIRLNQNGIAVSTTGADGPFYDFAVYYDETLNKYLVNADDISVGTLRGVTAILDKGLIAGWNIETDNGDKQFRNTREVANQYLVETIIKADKSMQMDKKIIYANAYYDYDKIVNDDGTKEFVINDKEAKEELFYIRTNGAAGFTSVETISLTASHISGNSISLKKDGSVKNFYNEMLLNDKGAHVLWSGEKHMTADETITLSEKISDQSNGIVLIWSPYTTESDGTFVARNYNFQDCFISKKIVDLHNNSGHDFFLEAGGFAHIGRKYLFISDTKIKGYDDNIAAGSKSGISYDNKYFVLRYVIGV